MQFFFEFGEYFISAISKIGDFLLSKPFTQEFLSRYSFLLTRKAQIQLAMDSRVFEDVSVGSVLFGAALTGILSFKLIKFFLDIIT